LILQDFGFLYIIKANKIKMIPRVINASFTKKNERPRAPAIKASGALKHAIQTPALAEVTPTIPAPVPAVPANQGNILLNFIQLQVTSQL